VREIVKGQEPPSLTAHRLTLHSNYDNYVEKDALRNALAGEQRALCCYCMGRIRNVATAMKIEHWQSQRRFPAAQLRYRNLLGSCLGGHGQPSHLQHCDTRKGDRSLKWNPAEPAHHIETRVGYDLDGTIRSDDQVFQEEINRVLNLNLALIRNNRYSILKGLLAWWKAEKPVPRARIEHEIDTRTTCAGELSPYCQVAVWWLRQKLARME
jgi:uncharacterized protein (TIGR02646 family)